MLQTEVRVVVPQGVDTAQKEDPGGVFRLDLRDPAQQVVQGIPVNAEVHDPQFWEEFVEVPVGGNGVAEEHGVAGKVVHSFSLCFVKFRFFISIERIIRTANEKEETDHKNHKSFHASSCRFASAEGNLRADCPRYRLLGCRYFNGTPPHPLSGLRGTPDATYLVYGTISEAQLRKW